GAGAAGAARAGSGFVVNGGVMTLDHTAAVNLNGLGEAAGVTLRGGTLSLLGNASTLTTETAGTLTSGGTAAVSVTAGASAGARLTFAGLARSNGGTFLFDGSNLGAAPAHRGANNLLTAAPPAPP